MSVTNEQVRHIAKLARIAMSDEELERMVPELNSILGWVEQLGEVNTDGVEPMAQVLFEAGDLATLREDEPHVSLSNADAVRNAPISGQGYFKVPRVIER